MRRVELIKEAQELSLLEFYLLVINFFKDTYDLTVTIERSEEDYFVYVADYALDVIELEDDAIAKKLKSYFNSKYPYDNEKAEEVLPTAFGYQIIMQSVEDKEELEKADDDLLKTEATEETMEELDGLSKDMTVEDIAKKHGVSVEQIEEQLVKGTEVELEHTSDEDIAIKIAMDHLVEMPDYYDKLATIEDHKLEPKLEALDSREDVESHMANQVLDNKFTWFFTITDSMNNIIEENIDDLSKAIDILVGSSSATKIVASPYVDPDPDNADVSLILADNPGPVVLYDSEESGLEVEEEGEV